MPLKEGKLPTDSEVDVSAASKTDRNTCNKLLCKLGYSRDDDIRYPKLIGQVYSRLRDEEGGNGSKAQERHLYKKLTQCKDNYPTAQEIPTKPLCKVYDSQNNTSSSSSSPSSSSSSSSSYTPHNNYRPQSNYRPPPPPPKASNPERSSPSDEVIRVLIAKQQRNQIRDYINGSFHTEVDELYNKMYALDRLASDTNDLIWKTNDPALKKKMNGLRTDLIGITGYIWWVSSAATLRSLKSHILAFDTLFDKFIKQYETKQRKNVPKPPKPPKAPKPPKTAKAPKPPKTAKAPKSPKARKGPKTAKAPTPPPKAPTPPPRASSTRKRCPNGTRRNKKTGNCEPK